MPDDQPLPLGDRNARGQLVERDKAVERCLQAELQPPTSSSRTRLPGPLQADSRGQGQLSAGILCRYVVLNASEREWCPKPATGAGAVIAR